MRLAIKYPGFPERRFVEEEDGKGASYRPGGFNVSCDNASCDNAVGKDGDGKEQGETVPIASSPASSLPSGCPPHLRYNDPMTFRVVIEFDPEARSFSAVCPELPGCASAGDTEAEAIENMEEAIRLYLEPSPLASDDAKLFEVKVA